MDFLPTEEQSQIIDSFREFLSAELPLSRLQHDSPAATDHSRWPQMAELGWFGIGIDAGQGGLGLTLTEEILLCIEAGAHLLSPALLATILGAHTASAGGQPALAAAVIAGQNRVALTVPRTGSTDAGDPVEAGISGEFLVIDGQAADYLLIATPLAAALVATADLPAGDPHPCIDESIQLSLLTLQHHRPAARLSSGSAGLSVWRRGVLLTAALSVGLAERSKQMSVDYAGQRHQFGRAIGSFQAVKHSCADMAVRCEAALSLLLQAGLETGDDHPASRFDADAARLLASSAAVANAEHSIQLHGAMGFTREMPVHLMLKRAHLLSVLFGNREQLLADIIAGPSPD